MSLATQHRKVFPESPFIAHDGEEMSGNDDNRTWDSLWRIIKGRHTPHMLHSPDDVFHELEPIPDYKAPLKAARAAAHKLRSWYIGSMSPHSWIN